MTVAELIALLQQHDPALHVHVDRGARGTRPLADVATLPVTHRAHPGVVLTPAPFAMSAEAIAARNRPAR